MSTKKAGWLIDYNGDQFIPMTSAFEIFNRHGARTFGNAEANDDNLGAQNQFIFINNGVFAPSTQSIGTDEKTLMYLNNGVFSRSTKSEGSKINPIYLSGGTLVASDETVGSATKLMYLSNGTFTESNGNVGSGTRPIYLSGGILTACNTNIGANDNFIYIDSDGSLTPSTENKGGDYTPLYLRQGKLVAGNNLNYTLSLGDLSNNCIAFQLLRNGNIQTGLGFLGTTNIVLKKDSSGNVIEISAGYQEAEYQSGLQISVGFYDDEDLHVPYASDSQYGVVKTGYTTSGRNFAVQLSDGKMYVNVPSDNTTYSAGNGLVLSGTEFSITKDSSYNIFHQLTTVDNDATATTYLISQDTGGAKSYYRRPAGKIVNATLVKAALGTGSGTTKYLREDGSWATPPGTKTDTKNTAGSTNSTSKLFLIGATSQAANPQTYSNSGVYATNGALTASSFNAGSDIRLKENFRPFVHNDIFDLPLYKFDYINGLKDRVGCIAQDLQKICPEIVHENEDGYLMIEESKIVYLLLDKMKEMQKEIDELKEV